MRTAARGRHQFCIREAGALRSIASQKQLLHFALQVPLGCIEGSAPGIDDYGPLWIQPIEGKAYGFPNAPLDAIAHHCLPDCAGNSEADSWPVGLRFKDTKGREQRTGVAGSAIVNSSKVF
jgi:hypothetical protein